MNAKKDTLSFIICKATGGITYVDPMFTSNWKNISDNGFIKGTYHFYYCHDDPIDQAKNYLNTVGTISSTDLPPIVDFEETSIDQSMSVEEIQSDLIQYLDYIKQETGRNPMIYTDPNTGNHYLDNPKFAEYTLWEADYIKADQPNLPSAWKGTKWMFWQQSDHYEINNTTNDFDLFNGSVEELKKFILGS